MKHLNRLGAYVAVTFTGKEPMLGILKGIHRSAEGIRYDIELRLGLMDDGAYDYTRIENVESRFVTMA